MQLATFKLWRILAFVSLVSLFSINAHAATSLDVSSGSTTFGDTFSGLTSFSDSYSFTLSGTSDLGTNVVSSFTTVQGLSISSFTLSNGSISYSGTDVTGIGSFWTLSATDLSQGLWTLTVSGKTLASAASYAGTLAVTGVSAVPEADSYSMMAVGLGLIGFVVRRRMTS